MVSVSRGWLIAFKGSMITSVECYVHDSDLKAVHEYLSRKLAEIK